MSDLGGARTAQALSEASKASPGLPVLVLEDDVQVASFFALRVSRLINAIEVRRGQAACRLTAHSGCCVLRDTPGSPWPGSCDRRSAEPQGEQR